MKSLISIDTISRSTDEDIAQHSSIRLDALLINPDAFHSTYERESQFDPAQWKETLDQEGVWTFYAKCDEVDENDHIIPQTSPRPWVGTLTLYSPAFLTEFLASSSPNSLTTNTVASSTPTWPLSLLGADTDLWLIVGVWVRPQWRRKSVAKRIVQKAIHFVASLGHSDGTLDASVSDAYQPRSGSSNTKKTMVILEVYARNTAAVEFYQTVGFKILSPPPLQIGTITDGSSVDREGETEKILLSKPDQPAPPPLQIGTITDGSSVDREGETRKLVLLSNPDQPAPPPLQAVGTITNGSSVDGEGEKGQPKTHWMGYTIPPLPLHHL